MGRGFALSWAATICRVSPLSEFRTAAAPDSKTLHPMLLAVWLALRAMLLSVVRTLHLLWLEVMGFFFSAFAVIGGFASVREYRAWAAGDGDPLRLGGALVFTLTFGWFGVTSFWRARTKGRPIRHG